ncbi:hypothetical protein Nmel_015923, partial [Mimus melanotis]
CDWAVAAGCHVTGHSRWRRRQGLSSFHSPDSDRDKKSPHSRWRAGRNSRRHTQDGDSVEEMTPTTLKMAARAREPRCPSQDGSRSRMRYGEAKERWPWRNLSRRTEPNRGRGASRPGDVENELHFPARWCRLPAESGFSAGDSDPGNS